MILLNLLPGHSRTLIVVLHQRTSPAMTRALHGLRRWTRRTLCQTAPQKRTVFLSESTLSQGAPKSSNQDYEVPLSLSQPTQKKTFLVERRPFKWNGKPLKDKSDQVTISLDASLLGGQVNTREPGIGDWGLGTGDPGTHWSLVYCGIINTFTLFNTRATYLCCLMKSMPVAS